jgi:hypothetical protein
MTIVTRSSCRRTDSGTWVQDNDYARPILSLKLRPGSARAISCSTVRRVVVARVWYCRQGNGAGVGYPLLRLERHIILTYRPGPQQLPLRPCNGRY